MVEQKAAISIPPMVPPELMTGIQITTNNKLGSGSGDFGEIIFELLGGSVVILTLPRTVDCYYLQGPNGCCHFDSKAFDDSSVEVRDDGEGHTVPDEMSCIDPNEQCCNLQSIRRVSALDESR